MHVFYRVRLCNRRVSHFETSPALPCPKSAMEKGEKKNEMHMVTRRSSTWPPLISSDNTGGQEDASQCTKNSLPLCKHIKFSLKLIYWPTCSLTLTLSTFTTLFWGEKKTKANHSPHPVLMTAWKQKLSIHQLWITSYVICLTTHTDYKTYGLLHHVQKYMWFNNSIFSHYS